LNSLGYLYDLLGRSSQALESYRIAIEKDRLHIERYIANILPSYYNLGNLLRKMKLYKEAIDNFNRAISLRPERAQLYHSLGNVYFEMVDRVIGKSRVSAT
jgi:tetratricopeptide (TPR) repeat protein